MSLPKLLSLSLMSILLFMTLSCNLFQNTDSTASPEPTAAPTVGSISGKVILKGASSPEGISVCIEPLDGLVAASVAKKAGLVPTWPASRAITATATSDSLGRYTFEDLSPGNYTVYALSNTTVEQAASTIVQVKAGSTATASDLNLTATGTLTGTLSIDGSTSGHAGAYISIAGTSYSASTDANGVFTISGIPVADDYTLVVIYSGLTYPLAGTWDISADTTTTTDTLSITTPQEVITTGSISGSVSIDGSSTGNAGVLVCVAGTSYSAVTDDSGSFTISNVPAGSAYVLVAICVGKASILDQILAVSAGNTTHAGTISITTPQETVTTGSISGTVSIDGASSGNAGVMVCVAGTSYSAVTDDSGAFTITNVPEGSGYVLVAITAGKSTVMNQSLTVSPGSTTDAGTISITSSTGTLEPSTTVTLVMYNIPSTYKYASVYVGTFDQADENWSTTYYYRSEVGEVTNGKATLIYSIPKSQFAQVQAQYKCLIMDLYTDSSLKHEYMYYWGIDSNSNKFITDGTWSVNTADYGAYFGLKITGVDGDGWASFTNASWSITDKESNGTYSTYLAFTESSWTNLKSLQSAGNTLYYRPNRSNRTITKYLWENNFPALGDYGVTTTVDISSASKVMDYLLFTVDGTMEYSNYYDVTDISLTLNGESTPLTIVQDKNYPLSFGLEPSLRQAVCTQGFTLILTYGNGLKLQWDMPPNTFEALSDMEITMTDATVLSHASSTRPSNTISTTNTGSYTITGLNSLMEGYTFTPTKLRLNINAYSSADWNFKCTAYTTEGCVAANSNLVATNGPTWWGALTDYYVTGGTGTTYASNVGGTKGTPSSYGGILLVVDRTIDIPLVDYSSTNDSVTFYVSDIVGTLEVTASLAE